jgi:hypothetical protein
MQTAIDDPIEEAETLLGQAALRIWGDLPRAAQELLFESAVENADHMRRLLAVFLHDRHPRTFHPIKPPDQGQLIEAVIVASNDAGTRMDKDPQ